MAYTGNWTAASVGRTYGVGMDEPGGTRYVRPDGGQSSGLYTIVTTPSNDWQFDPRVTTYNGRVLFDRLVVGTNGIGSSIEPNVPLTGLVVQLRDSAGKAVAASTLDSNGDFSIRGLALDGSQNGSLVITAQNTACIVKNEPGKSGAVWAYTIAANVSFANSYELGTVTIGNSNDPSGLGRSPLNIARTVAFARDWAQQRTSTTIPRFEVLWDPNAVQGTTYTRPIGTADANMRISGLASNPDAWDDDVIRRTYGRFILGVLAANASTTTDVTFDKITDAENAFAEGFGYYFNAAMTGNRTFLDGVTPTTTTVIDLENPTLSARQGADVAGWVAAALYDTVDPANEPWDKIDGTVGTEADKVFRTVDALTSPVTIESFYDAWGRRLGYDGFALSTLFIHYGVLGDDPDEPNDVLDQSTQVAEFGFLRPQRILNIYNDDWYRFTMPIDVDKLTVDVAYNRVNYNTTVGLDLYDDAGNLISTGAPIGTIGNIEAVATDMQSGNYRVRVRHLTGQRLPVYAVVVFSTLRFKSPEFPSWTVGRPYNIPVAIEGGIPPYDLRVLAPFIQPPGIILDGVNARVRGVPSQAGEFNFVLSAQDIATPPNTASGPITFKVNEQLALGFGEFQAFAYDKDVEVPFPSFGGTAPYIVTVDEGALPTGISAQSGATIHFSGHAQLPGSFYFKVTGTDVAGSSDTKESIGVVCMPLTSTAPLAAGGAATGYYFDAVLGTSVNLTVKTEKGQPKRLLRVQVLDVDGNTVLDVPARGRKGSVAVAKFVAPSTGRFYCVVAAQDAGVATRLSGAGKIIAPKKGSGDSGPNNFVAPKRFFAPVGALEGATLSFTATPDSSGLSLKALYLIDPDGNVVPLEENEVVTKGRGFAINKVLDASGTWQVAITANPGPQGHFRYAFRLREPSGVTFSND